MGVAFVGGSVLGEAEADVAVGTGLVISSFVTVFGEEVNGDWRSSTQIFFGDERFGSALASVNDTLVVGNVDGGLGATLHYCIFECCIYGGCQQDLRAEWLALHTHNTHTH